MLTESAIVASCSVTVNDNYMAGLDHRLDALEAAKVGSHKGNQSYVRGPVIDSTIIITVHC